MSLSDTARDLDETRRLLYAALLSTKVERRYELAGTLVNALVHHGLQISEAEATGHVVAVLNSRDEASMTWMREQIQKLTGMHASGG